MLDWDEAAKYFTAGPVMHKLSDIKAALAEHHAGVPQRAMLADRAIEAIRVALDELAALGHHFSLVHNGNEPPLKFPQMLYRDGTSGLETREVESSDELDEALRAGWQEHPSERRPVPARLG